MLDTLSYLICDMYFQSERLAYVQSAWEGGEVAEVACKSEDLTIQNLQQISISLLNEVKALHSRGCFHGEITPKTVIIKDNSVKLMFPDFSKKPVS